jgi:AcrR family transcriptional regulator
MGDEGRHAMTVRSRREEYAEATKEAIIKSGLESFAEKGYLRASLDEVADHARVTKGAVYHHFSNKREVFEAVFTMVISAGMSQLRSRMSAYPDTGKTVIANLLNSYFDICVDRVYYRIVLQEGPAALGWELWRNFVQESIEHPLLTMAKNSDQEPDTSPISDELLIRILTNAIHELALTVVDNPNRARAAKEARLLIGELATSFELKGQPPSKVKSRV